MSNLFRSLFVLTIAVGPALAQDCDCNSGYSGFAAAPISYASAPIMSTGASGCVPIAQCVTVPMQCQVVQPQFVERQVERTVMVPKLVNEKRTVREVKYDRVRKERPVTVYETRPRVRTVQQQRQILEPVTREKKEYYTRLVPVREKRQREVTVSVPERVARTGYRTEYRTAYREIPEEYTEMVPVRVRKQATRTVARDVPVTRSQTVMRDAGYWATQQVAVQQPMTQAINAATVSASSGFGPCNACVPVSCSCTQYMTRRVYVPRTVACKQNLTSVQREYVKVPYEYDEVTYEPRRRQRMVRQSYAKEVRVPYKYEEVVYRPRKEYRTEEVERMVEQRRERTIRFTEMVPRTKIDNVKVTEYEEVPVKKTETYTALVPREVEREVTVQVYRNTPRKVTETVRVPVTGSVIR